MYQTHKVVRVPQTARATNFLPRCTKPDRPAQPAQPSQPSQPIRTVTLKEIEDALHRATEARRLKKPYLECQALWMCVDVLRLQYRENSIEQTRQRALHASLDALDDREFFSVEYDPEIDGTYSPK